MILLQELPVGSNTRASTCRSILGVVALGVPGGLSPPPGEPQRSVPRLRVNWRARRLSSPLLERQTSRTSSLYSWVAAGYVNSGSARPPRVSRLPQPCRLKRVLPVVGLLGEPKTCWPCVSGHLSGVCGWLANGYCSTRTLGGVLSSVSAFRVLTGDRNPPPGGRMLPGVAVERPDR